MSFKIVQTKKKNGSLELAVVPTAWEKENTVKWPSSSMRLSQIKKMLQDPTSVPGGVGKDWNEFKCTVKQQNIATFDEAEILIKTMQQRSDSESEAINKTNMPAPTSGKRPLRVTATVSKNPDEDRLNLNAKVNIPYIPYISISSFCGAHSN